MSSMKQSGRVSLLALGSVFCVVVIALLLFFSRESPVAAGTRFMVALQHHDVDTLTKMTKMEKASDEDIRKQWDFTVNQAEKYYQFGFRIAGSGQASDTTASVKVQMIHDIDKPGAYEQLYELPMVKDGDQWKVDVRGLSREFYNCLPR
jgi:hypothetical protein